MPFNQNDKRSTFDQLAARGSMYAVFVRQMLIAGYHDLAPGQSVKLRWAQQQAMDELKRLGSDIAVSTLGLYTGQLKKMKLITTRRDGQHFDMMLTERGARVLEKLTAELPAWGTLVVPAATATTVIDDDEREELLDGLLVSGKCSMPFVVYADRTEAEKKAWRVLYDEWRTGRVDIWFVESDLDVEVVERG